MKNQNLILFDGEEWNQLLPLTFTRSVADIRCGIFTIKEKWQGEMMRKAYVLTKNYLQCEQELLFGEENIYINSSLLPSEILINELGSLQPESVLTNNDKVVAIRTEKLFFNLNQLHQYSEKCSNRISTGSVYKRIARMWDIFLHNAMEIELDIRRMGMEANGEELDNNHNIIIGAENIFVEVGVKAQAAIINATDGPVYIGDGVEIMEGAIIKGPVAICAHSQVKMGAKIYGNTTIGPHSKAGGEIQSSVIFGYSNKGHDGYLGNSVLGEWCNLGADTNNSNLKNNYSMVKVYDYESRRMENSGQQFCGLFMADYAKSGINTMFNTGTSVGVAANVFGGGFPDKMISSFAWGGKDGWEEFSFDKACESAERMMERRKLDLDEKRISILKHIFETTKGDRVF